MGKAALTLPVIAVALIGILSSVFIVDERETALVLQFGRIVSVKTEPGLAFKIPLIQEVVRYDSRILSRDIDPLEVTPLDDRRLMVDAFARYRIIDVNQFRQAVGVGGIPVAENRLDSILKAQIRQILGSVSSNDILSEDRAALMLRIRNGAIEDSADLGVEIIDVRLKRTDLPDNNLAATFARMRAEREREAADEIARGNEAAQEVRLRLIGPSLRSSRTPSVSQRSFAVKLMPSAMRYLPRRLGPIQSSLNSTGHWRPIACRSKVGTLQWSCRPTASFLIT